MINLGCEISKNIIEINVFLIKQVFLELSHPHLGGVK
jgi:hypothetical protein